METTLGCDKATKDRQSNVCLSFTKWRLTTAEELGVLLSSMRCKEASKEIERKKADENDSTSKILRRAAKILENYGTAEKFEINPLVTNKLTINAEKDTDDYLYDEKVKKLVSKTMKVFTACSKELKETGTHEALKAHIEDSSLQLVKLSHVVNTQMQLQTELKNVQQKMEDFKKESERLLFRRRRLIELLNSRLQELRIKVNMEKRFWVKNVEVAVAEERTRQSEREDKLSTAIAKAGLDVVNEKRTQSDINAWMLNNNARLEAQIEYMADKHRTNFATLQKAYSELVTKRNKQLDVLTTMIYEFKRMDDVVEEYKAQMAEKKKREEKENELDETAVKIQAWWRCMIVIHKISWRKKKGKKVTRKRRK
ncbi:Dynein regulatory complex protein 9 [Taenia crassiceps]|uniref:Dynein regulatory complex protein 9 n=1 Tax=Taenia crassiceps TaxID=6207 RepID=A0ABR4QHS3_9CEST